MSIEKNNVFIGTIKKCHNVSDYNKYGDTRFIPEFIFSYMTLGTTQINASEVIKDAILIRTKKAYVYVGFLDSFIDRVLVDLGFTINPMYTKPTHDGQYFVDVSSLKPYFDPETNIKDQNKINVKRLKKQDF